MERPPRIAVCNTTGGAGKTTVALSVAVHWADTIGPVALVDLDDTQETDRAIDRLAATDAALSLPNLGWAGSTTAEIASVIDQVTDRAVIIDTPPLMRGEQLQELATLMDLVIIPGSSSETASMTSTIKHLYGRVPLAIVVTKTRKKTRYGQTGKPKLDALAEVVPIIGDIRDNQALEDSYDDELLPTQLRRKRSRTAWSDDMNDIFAELRKLVTVPEAARK